MQTIKYKQVHIPIFVVANDFHLIRQLINLIAWSPWNAFCSKRSFFCFKLLVLFQLFFYFYTLDHCLHLLILYLHLAFSYLNSHLYNIMPIFLLVFIENKIFFEFKKWLKIWKWFLLIFKACISTGCISIVCYFCISTLPFRSSIIWWMKLQNESHTTVFITFRINSLDSFLHSYSSDK